jgi:hypothetical protein
LVFPFNLLAQFSCNVKPGKVLSALDQIDAAIDMCKLSGKQKLIVFRRENFYPEIFCMKTD